MDFNIRQLYYPYRVVYDKIQNAKEIISIFIFCDNNNNIHIWKYKWEDSLKLDSICNTGYYKYKFQQ